MNRSDFLKMIEEAGPSNRQMTGEINEIIGIFPYCQSAYMLLLKGLLNTSDVSFENQLRTSAMRIADREVLYYYLKEGNEEVRDEKEIQPEKETESVPGIHDSLDDDMPDSQQVVIETAKNSEDLINEIEKSKEQGETAEPGDDRLHFGQRPVFIHAGSENGDSGPAVIFLDDDPDTQEDKVIYMDPGFSAPVEGDDELLELDTESQAVSTGEESTTEGELYSGDKSSMKQHQSELIDKFILTDPRIKPSKEKSDTPNEDISIPFTEDKGEFVTETLARIYTSQGYYSRAIDIYKKLSLKFPEKSSYFASQIEKVQELIKK
jgi:hypothetical protein